MFMLNLSCWKLSICWKQVSQQDPSNLCPVMVFEVARSWSLQRSQKSLILDDQSRFIVSNTGVHLRYKMKWKCNGQSRGIKMSAMQIEFKNSVHYVCLVQQMHDNPKKSNNGCTRTHTQKRNKTTKEKFQHKRGTI